MTASDELTQWKYAETLVSAKPSNQPGRLLVLGMCCHVSVYDPRMLGIDTGNDAVVLSKNRWCQRQLGAGQAIPVDYRCHGSWGITLYLPDGTTLIDDNGAYRSNNCRNSHHPDR